MDRIGPQPVRIACRATVERQCERRDRPVLLAFDFECLTEPRFRCESGTALGRSACEELCESRQIETARDCVSLAARPEKVRNQQRTSHRRAAKFNTRTG